MNATTKTKARYSITLLDGSTVTGTTTKPLAWAVVVEDSADRSWSTSRHGVYAKSSTRDGAVKRADEARKIGGEFRFAQVAIVPLDYV